MEKRLFRGVITIYILVLAIIVVGILGYVYALLRGFEASQPERIVEQQIAMLKEAANNGTLDDVLVIDPGLSAYLGGITTLPKRYTEKIKNEEMTYSLVTGGYDSTDVEYYIVAGGNAVAKTTLRSSNQITKMVIFTSADWEVVKIEPIAFKGDFKLSQSYRLLVDGAEVTGTPDGNGNEEYSIRVLGDTDVELVDIYGHKRKACGTINVPDSKISVTVPADYRVTMNGGDVPEAFVKEHVLNAYKYTREYCKDIPAVKSYRVRYFAEDGFEPDISIKDEQGNPVEYVPDLKIGGDLEKVPVTSAEVPEELIEDADVLGFAHNWSLFMTDDLPGATHGIKTISKYFIKDSYLQNVAKKWATGEDITFTSRHSLLNPPFVNEKVSNYTKFSENCFSCDVYFEKQMSIGRGMRHNDVFNSTIYFVYYDDPADKAGARWFVTDMQEII